MVAKIFVDTDVIIDFLIDRDPHFLSSSRIFELCEKGRLHLFTSVLCISNVHYIVRKVMGEKKTRWVIEELADMMYVLDVLKEDIQHALNSEFNDFEDAMQHSVALREKGIKAIVTRNIQDFRKSKIAVFTPEDFVRMLEDE